MTAPTPATQTATARVVSVQEGLVQIQANADASGQPGQLVKNEVVFILPTRPGPGGRQERLKAEVLRVRGDTADVQVYESTDGVAVGDPVEQSGQLLSVELGPGLLGQVFTQLTGLMKNFHYAAENTPEFKSIWQQITDLCRDKFGV
jgi:V/A-type H+-transporting ATPase subunit A